jgi:hypothetical protein
MLKHVSVVVGCQKGVDGHRYDASVDRPEKSNRPVVHVLHRQKDAFLALDAKLSQAGSETTNPVFQLAVS